MRVKNFNETVKLCVEEMNLSGNGVSLGGCSRSTAYRYRKAVNDILERKKCKWRTKMEYDARTRMASLEPENLEVSK